MREQKHATLQKLLDQKAQNRRESIYIAILTISLVIALIMLWV